MKPAVITHFTYCIYLIKPWVVTQFIHFLYLYKLWYQELLHNSYIAFICINHETSSYNTIHTFSLAVQTMKLAVIAQIIYCVYLYKWSQTMKPAHFTLHISYISTMKSAAIIQLTYCLYLYKSWNQQLLYKSYIAYICTNHETSSNYIIHTLPLSIQTMKQQ